MLWRRVKRNSFASSPDAIPVATAPTATFARLIILPITPPLELDAAIRVGFKFRLVAVTTCKLPNSAFADVSLPVRNTPSQPSRELKNGKRAPGAEKARPRVASPPQRL